MARATGASLIASGRVPRTSIARTGAGPGSGAVELFGDIEPFGDMGSPRRVLEAA